MSNPDLDDKLARYLAEREAEQRVGVSLSTVHDAIMRLADNFAEHVRHDDARFAKNEERWSRFRAWREKVRESLNASRPQLPTLNPDDSGSIEIGALGAKAAFHGKLPVRVAVVLLVMCLGVGAGYIAGCRVHAAGLEQAKGVK